MDHLHIRPAPPGPAGPAGPGGPRAVGGARSAADAARIHQSQEWVFDRAPSGLAVVDAGGRLVAVNASLVRMLGRERAEVLGQHLTALLAPDQRAAAEEWFARAREHEGPLHLHGWIRPEVGPPVWVSIRSDRMFDPEGPLGAVVVSVIDLTEQRRLEGQLASARGDLTSLFRLAPVGLVRLDAAGRVQAWNPATERLLGWREDEVLGHLPPVVPEGADQLHRTYQERALAGDPLDGTPITCRRRDGELVEALAWTYLTDPAEGPAEVVVLLADVTGQVEATRALQAAEHRWRSLVENISDTVTVVGADGTLLATTGEIKPILGYPADAWRQMQLLDLLHPDDRERLQPEIQRVTSTPGAEAEVEVRLRHHDGTWVEVAVSAVNLVQDPQVRGVVLTTRNIVEQKRAERLVASQAEILELIARGAVVDEVLHAVAAMVEDHDEGAVAAVVLMDEDHLRPRAADDRGPGPAVRAALSRMVLPPDVREALRGRHGEPVVVPDALADPRTRDLAPALAEEGLGSIWWASARVDEADRTYGGIVALHEQGHVPSDHALRAADVACSLLAIAMERDSTLAALAHKELHDELTGLPNRTLLIDRIQTGLERARRADGEVALLYIDLDHFKRINDSGGLVAGDEVLTLVARHLQEITRPGDTVARVGADEFVILCDQTGSLSTVLAVADRLGEALRQPIPVGGHEVFVTASMGLALGRDDTDAAELLGQADVAMDRAKQRGRNRLEVYDPAMQATASDRLTLGSDLHRALAREEMRVVYQPIVDLVTGVVVGAEALLRWDHPARGSVPPDVFIPVAEESGAIVDIGMWVLETALAEIAPRVPDGDVPFTLAVNLSPRQLEDPTLVARVQAALRRHAWPAERLCLELTETALTEDLDLALHVLVRLRATGMRIAVDDFGTGYSSLTHLQQLPIDSIKIDRSFVHGLGDHPGSERSTIARCVMGIASAMDLEAVAEGVETPAQLEALRRLGCGRGQGYLFSVPVPVEALEVPTQP